MESGNGLMFVLSSTIVDFVLVVISIDCLYKNRLRFHRASGINAQI